MVREVHSTSLGVKGSPYKVCLRGALTPLYSYLKEGCGKVEIGLFSKATSKRKWPQALPGDVEVGNREEFLHWKGG